MTKILLFFLLLLLYAPLINAQCTNPSSIGNSTTITAACPGNGKITVGAVSPALTDPDFYQYAIYSDDSTLQIKPWQSSNIFDSIAAGNYRIWVRSVCFGGFSAVLTQPVTVTSSYISANINSIIPGTIPDCSGGSVNVDAYGSAPLQYATVTGLTAPDGAANIIKPKQSSNVLSSLTPGVHYVRVYDACGGYATQAVIVNAVAVEPTLGNIVYKRRACDSFTLYGSFSQVNTSDPGTAWIVWPGGTTDSIALSPDSANVNGTISIQSNFGYASLDANYNPDKPFPANVGAMPKVITVGYKDNCGNVDTFQKLFDVGVLSFVITEGADIDCDSLPYTFYMQHDGMLPYPNVFLNSSVILLVG